MAQSTFSVLPLLPMLSLLYTSMAQNTTTVNWPTTTLTTLGYTLEQLVPPASANYTSYTLATPLVCPQGYVFLRLTSIPIIPSS